MDALIERIKRAQQARDNNKESATPGAAPSRGSPSAEILQEKEEIAAEEAPAEDGALHQSIVALAAAREEAAAGAGDGGTVDHYMIELRKKRLLEEVQCATEPAPSAQQNTPTSQLRSGAANTSTGKYVTWANFKAGRHPDDTPSKRSAPMPEDSEDGSDEEVDDQGITMGPMGDAPVQRMAEDNLKAAVKFVEQLGNVECAQRHFDDATITGTQSDVNDYTASIAASSHGYITLIMGRAIKLEEFLATRDDFVATPGSGMRIHGHVHARAIIAFLNQEAKNGRTARQGAEAQIRKLRTWGFDFVVDSDANANARKAAPKPGKRDAKPANPFDLDMAAHIGYGVADTTLTATQRGCFAQIEIMQQGVLRHVNANRCGELTDRSESGDGTVNPHFLHGRVAVDAKKALEKKFDKPFCAVKRTFTGFEYGPILIQSLQGVADQGYLVRDISAASANPFEEGCTFIDKPMNRNRTLRMIGHLLRAKVMYPTGQRQCPTRPDRFEHLGVQAARHVLPAAAGARFEPRRAIREIGIWSKSAAEDTTVPGMGRLADLVTTAWGTDPDEDGTAHSTPDQYAIHGTTAALPSIILRQHRAISALIQQHAADLTALAGTKGWMLLHQAAWPGGFNRATAVTGTLAVQGGCATTQQTEEQLALAAAAGQVGPAGPGAPMAATTANPIGAPAAAGISDAAAQVAAAVQKAIAAASAAYGALTAAAPTTGGTPP